MTERKHTVRSEEMYMKGLLAGVFSGVSVFTCFYAYPQVAEYYSYETEWKWFMFWLSVFLTIPSVYQTSVRLNQAQHRSPLPTRPPTTARRPPITHHRLPTHHRPPTPQCPPPTTHRPPPPPTHPSTHPPC